MVEEVLPLDVARSPCPWLGFLGPERFMRIVFCLLVDALRALVAPNVSVILMSLDFLVSD